MQNVFIFQQLLARELTARYRASRLGPLWMILTPLLMLSVYTLIFGEVFGARWELGGSTLRFALLLFCGLIVFTAFSDVFNGAPSAVSSTPNYVKKVVFPLELVPAVLVGNALVVALVAIGVLGAGLLLIEGSIPPSFLAAPVVLASMIPLLLGIGWLLAALGVYVRDLQHTTAVVSSVLLFISPLFFPSHKMPERFRFLIDVNPLVVPIDTMRAVALGEPMPSVRSLALFLAGSLLFMVASLRVFQRLKRGFADVL